TEADRLRTGPQIGGEQGAQRSAPHHVLPPVLLEAEPVGALPFIRGERAAQPLDLGGGRIEPDRPDVDLAGRALQAGFRRGGRAAGHQVQGGGGAPAISARSRATASSTRSLLPWMKKWSPGNIRARNR